MYQKVGDYERDQTRNQRGSEEGIVWEATLYQGKSMDTFLG